MPVSYSVCVEISQTRDIWKNQGGHREDTEEIVRVKRSGDTGSTSVSRSYSYAGEYYTKSECGTVCRISEGKEQIDDI